MRAIRKIDTLAYAIVIGGAVYAAFSDISDRKRPKFTTPKRPAGSNILYGLMGAATLYQFARMIGPKPRPERHIQKLTQLYDQAESYGARARIYRRTAESILKRRLSNLKTASAS